MSELQPVGPGLESLLTPSRDELRPRRQRGRTQAGRLGTALSLGEGRQTQCEAGGKDSTSRKRHFVSLLTTDDDGCLRRIVQLPA